ncbi:MAG: hypothetical protein HOO19_06435 [Rhodospirillaceae bacterium]|jgi:hypothetical protein|nr:hypothetical protein [Rhodospirillaceae bacterium]MBT3886385.1 hypothetical protein [Rhodospirillaceae bacterium]MBT4118998.1 hypothetical protein [Rhodospirillaceae bacterium]MBT4674033.1 hypothetical protein [Rhodospirillaceae bacterium]MBT4719922.1 hypothetical protein [Rhodospirillaceae bacterium]
MNFLDSLTKWINQLTKIVVVLIPLAITIQVLFGAQVAFFGSVVKNLIDLLNAFGAQGLIGLIALGIVIWLFGKTDRS